MKFLGFLLCAILSLNFLGANSNQIYRRIINPDGRMLTMTCPNSQQSSVTCAVCDNSWPEQQHSNCGGQNIHPFAVTTVADSITKCTNFQEDQNVPDAIKNACPNAKIFSHSHVKFKAFFTLDVQCNCGPNQIPKCSGSKTITSEACALTTVKYCGMTVGNSVCPK